MLVEWMFFLMTHFRFLNRILCLSSYFPVCYLLLNVDICKSSGFQMSGDDKSFKLVDQKWKSVSPWLILQPHSVKLQDGCIVALKPHRDASCTLSLGLFVHRANVVTQNNEKPSAQLSAYLLQRLHFFFF